MSACLRLCGLATFGVSLAALLVITMPHVRDPKHAPHAHRVVKMRHDAMRAALMVQHCLCERRDPTRYELNTYPDLQETIDMLGDRDANQGYLYMGTVFETRDLIEADDPRAEEVCAGIEDYVQQIEWAWYDRWWHGIETKRIEL